MSTAAEVPETSKSAPARRWRWLGGAGVVVALAVAAVMVIPIVRRPHELRAFGNALAVRLHAGQVHYVDAQVEPSGTGQAVLDVRSIRPRVASNTARAGIAVLECTRSGTAGGLGDSNSTQGLCASVRVFRSGRLVVGADDEHQVILAITTRQAGEVHIAGLDVNYRLGWRSGSQHTGQDIVIHARG